MSWSENTRLKCGKAARSRRASTLWLWSTHVVGPSGEVRIFDGEGSGESLGRAERWCRSRPGWDPCWRQAS